MAWTQYQSGVSYPILKRTDMNLPHIQGRCIPDIRQYLCDIGGSYVQRPLRQNDTSLMEMALVCPLTDIQLTQMNCVRMYLGVMYLSEICTLDGKSISPGVLNRTRDIDEYKTNLT